MNEQKVFLLGILGLLLGVTWFMVQPFLSYILFGVILAFLLYPLQRRVSRLVGGRISAFLLMIFAFLVAVIPLALATGAVIQDASDLPSDIQQSELINTTVIEAKILKYTGQEVDVEAAINTAIKEFTSLTFGSFSQLLGIAMDISVGLTLMLFMLYYLLKDGRQIALWFKKILPLPADIKDNLYERVNVTTWAVITGHVLVAVVQGLVAGVGLFFTGVPNYVFWTFIMVLLGFIPIIGTFVVWGPAAIYLFMIDEPVAGAVMLAWGSVVVGLTDNVLRPLIVDRKAQLHPAAILIGVLGGVYLFGAAGLFFGPILIGVLKAVLKVLVNNYSEI